jgi:hypothetical protein
MTHANAETKTPSGKLVNECRGGGVVPGQTGIEIRDRRPKGNSLGGLGQGQTKPKSIAHAGAIDAPVLSALDLPGKLKGCRSTTGNRRKGESG